MKSFIAASIILMFSVHKCGNNSGYYFCSVDWEERVLIENPYERHGAGVIIFNEKYSLDFKEVELGYERDVIATKILRNNSSILKDSNTVEILLFNREDTVRIREEDMFSKDKVFMKLCYRE